MFATICYIALVVAVFAALGRGTMPKSERVPLTRWTARDLFGNALLGVRRLLELDARNPLTTHRRTSSTD